MSRHDPISDLLTRIRNAKMANHRFLDVDMSKMRVSIVKVLQEKGFVDQYLLNDEKRKMRIFLKFDKNKRLLIDVLDRKSSPGRRVYIGWKEIPRIRGGMGTTILTTSKGVIDGETARQMKVGGELLCTVW